MNKMKSKSTQKKWIMSVAAVLICIAMLAGTTLAWFTDTDSATLNSIKAGNLDIELKHAVTTSSGTTYEDVDEETVLFTANNDGTTQILWEPGVLAYEVFQASNVGNLALQYKSILSVAGYNTMTDEDGTARSLADVLKVAVYEGTYSSSVDIDTLTFYDFDEITSASATGVLLSSSEAASASSSEDGSSSYSDADTFSLIIYWEPSGLDNYYNLNNDNTNSDGSAFSDGQEYLWISLGITLTATQYDYEYDSFTDQYDANATYAPVASVATLSTTDTITVWNSNFSSTTTPTAAALFSFSATEDSSEAASSEYASWNADFVVSFDNAVSSVTLVGKYDGWNNSYDDYYVPITLSSVEANSSTRLLKDKLTSVLGSSFSGYITYSELCTYVETFYCGVLDDYSVSSNTVMTVSLVLYETDSSSGSSTETGNSVTIATYTYTLTAGTEE